MMLGPSEADKGKLLFVRWRPDYTQYVTNQCYDRAVSRKGVLVRSDEKSIGLVHGTNYGDNCELILRKDILHWDIIDDFKGGTDGQDD